MSRDIVISFGWLAVFFVTYNLSFSFLKRILPYLEPNAPINYMKVMTAHKIVGLLALVLVFLHISKNISHISLTIGWALFFTFLIMVVTGMLGAMFSMGKKLRIVHITSHLLFITLLLTHLTTKLILHI